jgi:hypothetical protein
MSYAKNNDSLDEHEIHNKLYENGVECREVGFCNPLHIANLCVMWVSVYAFSDTEKADHTQVHHHQLLQSIHSLDTNDAPFSQAKMDEVMLGSGNTVRISTMREQVQQWMVNQRDSKKMLEMINRRTQCGAHSLVAWALTFANESWSKWKRRVG